MVFIRPFEGRVYLQVSSQIRDCYKGIHVSWDFHHVSQKTRWENWGPAQLSLGALPPHRVPKRLTVSWIEQVRCLPLEIVARASWDGGLEWENFSREVLQIAVWVPSPVRNLEMNIPNLLRFWSKPSCSWSEEVCLTVEWVLPALSGGGGEMINKKRETESYSRFSEGAQNKEREGGCDRKKRREVKPFFSCTLQRSRILCKLCEYSGAQNELIPEVTVEHHSPMEIQSKLNNPKYCFNIWQIWKLLMRFFVIFSVLSLQNPMCILHYILIWTSHTSGAQ